MAYPSDLVRTKDWGTETLTDSDLEGQLDLIIDWVMAAQNSSTGHKHDATSNEGPKIDIGTGIKVASQAQGDVIYASSASAFARLAPGTSGQFLKTQGAAANPVWSDLTIPQYRQGLDCTRTGTSTLQVDLGDAEVDGTMQSITSATTLTLGTAGDWAGGVSLQATSTYGYVGIDSSANLKLHTTAPSHSDYGVSNTNGVKRYATWSGTVYRIIGWFFMNSTGSGELDTYAVSNLKDVGIYNAVVREGATQDTINDLAYGSDLTETTLRFYSTGRPVQVFFDSTGTNIDQALSVIVDFDSSDEANSERVYTHGASDDCGISTMFMKTLSQGTHTITIQAKVNGGSDLVENKVTQVIEL